jgi:hypothetical protein
MRDITTSVGGKSGRVSDDRWSNLEANSGYNGDAFNLS